MAHLVLGCRLTFAERLDPDVLARATRLMLDGEPVLGCWFQERGLGARWVRCETMDAFEYFSFRDSTDPDEDAAVFHAEQFEERGPRFAVRLLRSRVVDDLCIRVDHLVADGWGTKLLAYMLADTYSRLLADPDYVPEPNLATRPNGSDLWNALTPEQRAAATTPTFVRPQWKMELSRGSGNGFRVRKLALGPLRFSSLKEYASSRGATVNDMLLAALMRSLARVSPPEPLTSFTPSVTADTRRFVDEPRLARPVVLASSQTLDITYDPADDFDTTLARVVECTRRCKQGLWGVKWVGKDNVVPYRLMQAAMAPFYRSMFRKGTAPPIVMNIGVMEEDRLSFGGVVPVFAHVTGSVFKGPGFGPTISTYRDTLTVWMGAFERVMDPEHLVHALAGMDKEFVAIDV